MTNLKHFKYSWLGTMTFFLQVAFQVQSKVLIVIGQKDVQWRFLS